MYFLVGGWAKTVLAVSFPGTMSDEDNVECVQPVGCFIHIYFPKEMNCSSLAWHFIIEL